MNDLKEHYDGHFRSANYLLAAHSVGLVGSISALKDYNSAPQLKGIGIFVVLFGVGLLGAIGNYTSSRLVTGRTYFERRILSSSDFFQNDIISRSRRSRSPVYWLISSM